MRAGTLRRSFWLGLLPLPIPPPHKYLSRKRVLCFKEGHRILELKETRRIRSANFTDEQTPGPREESDMPQWLEAYGD